MRKACIVLIATVFPFLLLNLPVSYAQDDDLKRADQLNKQVIQLYQQGKYAKAISVAKEVIAIDEKAFGPDHPNVPTSLNNLALLYSSIASYTTAEPLYRRSLASREKTLGPDQC
jgi:tetratricopeptide (TPR) repeat protein